MRTQITTNAGRMPIHSKPRQPIRSYKKPYARADSAKPRPQEPCRMPLMKPRERVGQDSMASAAPAGHSAPMPIPRIARKKNKKAKVGEKPAMKLQMEYHRMEIISGA